MMRRMLGTGVVSLLALTLGCSGVTVRTFTKPATGQRQYGKVKKVAVMPFDSVVEGAQPAKIAGDFFLQDLLVRGTFDAVEEPRYVSELMKKLKLRNTEGLDREIVRKIGEELQAQAIVLGNLLVMGQEENSEIVEFVLQVTMLDVASGDILWSGRAYSDASTSAGEIFGVNQGPSTNEVAKTGVQRLVARLDDEFRNAREAEVERMLEAAKAEKAAGEAGVPPEKGAPGEPTVAPEQEGEEILLEVKPK